MRYDYLIVGAGLYGAVFAREAMNRGKTCVVIDRRNHIAGNVYTQNVEGINVHVYGAHIFHTSNRDGTTLTNFASLTITSTALLPATKTKYTICRLI